MSSTQQRPTVRQYEGTGGEMQYFDDDSHAGWVMFAGVMLGVLGTLNLIQGIGAVSDSTFFVGDAKYIFSNLNTLGWALILLGAAQAVTALGVGMGWAGVRWVGVAFAALNGIAQMLVMPAYPFWAMCLFAIDVLVIYALVVHGGRRRDLA
jgi:hypothetical protein